MGKPHENFLSSTNCLSSQKKRLDPRPHLWEPGSIKDSSPILGFTQIPLELFKEGNIQDHIGPCTGTPGLTIQTYATGLNLKLASHASLIQQKLGAVYVSGAKR